MRSLVQSGLVLSLLVSAIAAGCSSSSSGDSSAGGAGGAAHAGAGGGSAHAGTSGEAGEAAGGVPGGGTGSTEAGAPNGGEPASAGGDSANTGGAADNAGAGGAQEPPPCNALVVSGSAVPLAHAAAAAAPTLTQGQIVAGEYQLTAETIYDGGTATTTARAVASISVSGTTATIQTTDDAGAHTNAVIEMGTPVTAAPVSVKITCSNTALYQAYIGAELKTAVSYAATATTFSLYAATLHTLTVFTLK